MLLIRTLLVLFVIAAGAESASAAEAWRIVALAPGPAVPGLPSESAWGTAVLALVFASALATAAVAWVSASALVTVRKRRRKSQ